MDRRAACKHASGGTTNAQQSKSKSVTTTFQTSTTWKYTTPVVTATVVESCARGIVDDCATVGAAVTQADPRAQAGTYGVPCRRWGRHCDHVAQLHAPDGPIPDPTALRDAHEHACQLGDNDDCLGLAKAYLAHQLPEPVPGRGKELATYLCSAGESEARDGGCAALHATDGSR